MSLDVYLKVKTDKPAGEAVPKIFIRRDGGTVEITRAEWDELNPGREPCMYAAPGDPGVVFRYNITHNLNTMAQHAGLYGALWRPDEMEITKAKHIIPTLKEGLLELTTNPAKYKAFNPTNGWGSYDGLVTFVTKYLVACCEYPEADIEVCR